MIEFKATNIEELEEEARQRAHEISLVAVKAVCKGIEEDVDVVTLAILTNLDMDISVKRENYLEALELNIGRVAEMEEYELCIKAKGYIEQLKLEINKRG